MSASTAPSPRPTTTPPATIASSLLPIRPVPRNHRTLLRALPTELRWTIYQLVCGTELIMEVPPDRRPRNTSRCALLRVCRFLRRDVLDAYASHGMATRWAVRSPAAMQALVNAECALLLPPGRCASRSSPSPDGAIAAAHARTAVVVDERASLSLLSRPINTLHLSLFSPATLTLAGHFTYPQRNALGEPISDDGPHLEEIYQHWRRAIDAFFRARNDHHHIIIPTPQTIIFDVARPWAGRNVRIAQLLNRLSAVICRRMPRGVAADLRFCVEGAESPHESRFLQACTVKARMLRRAE